MSDAPQKQSEQEIKEKAEHALEEQKEVEIKEKQLTREEMQQKEKQDALASWVPKTKLGKLVKQKKITNIDEVLENYKILESEIADILLHLKEDTLAIGQAKGKFGGGKRRVWRQTQKKTKEGNVPTFSTMVVVGDENGHVGLGYGRAKETLPARDKAVKKAKLNLIKVERACGSFDCACGESHTIPMKVEGKCGSTKIILTPAPQGTGLVVGAELKKILRLAGITDIYGKTFGHIRVTMNLAKACMDALKKTTKIEKVEEK